ncbi:hypothetical protein [Nitrosomonas sp. Nm166]|uniref:hypothetical protein n=1 Tax=Nitrosomonas sp. Nm166 TaxID=1881054 RepID=UPI000B888422|nr:hypothetical protein [Nitrosomonas sp. Nm166]
MRNYRSALWIHPPGQPFSITELEYQQVREHKLPTLISVKDDGAILSQFHDAVTQENPPDLIGSFRQRVNKGARGSRITKQ